MKYSIKYFMNCRTLPKADEIIIKYTHKTAELLDFVQEYEDWQRIVIDITEITDDIFDSLDIITAAHKLHKNFAIKTSKDDINLVNYYDAGIPYFFCERVDSFDELTGQINLGVSDVYIVNELGFYINLVSKICKEKGVNIRVYPNIAQSRTTLNIDNFRKFYIRPDDLEFYEEYVDIYEFFGPLDKQSVLYDIYNDEKWLGNLEQIILGLDGVEIDNKTIMPYFGSERPACMKRCVYGKCGICNNILSLAKTLEDKGIGITHEREFNEENMQNESATTISADAEISEIEKL